MDQPHRPASGAVSPDDSDAGVRRRALDQALTQISRAFGASAISTTDEIEPVDTISTSSLKLDKALGIGGLPRGRIVEVYGPESSGKTTLGLHLIAEAQRSGGTCAFVDAEHALDLHYARALDIDTDRLALINPANGDEALEITRTLLDSRAVDVIVIDSAAALVPRANDMLPASEQDGPARVLSHHLPRLTGPLADSRAILLFLNQLRSVESDDGSAGSSSRRFVEQSAGGKALKFYSSIRLDCRPLRPLRSGADRRKIIGHRTLINVAKNKLAPPQRSTQCDVIYGIGICRMTELIEIADMLGIFTRDRGDYVFKGTILGPTTSPDPTRRMLEKDPDLALSVRQAILAHADWTGTDLGLVSHLDEKP